MKTTEELLREAATAAGSMIPPGSAPPLRLPAEHQRRVRLPRYRGARHLPGWLTPLGGAAAAAAVIATVFAVSGQVMPMHLPGDPPLSEAFAGLPRYYLTQSIGDFAGGSLASRDVQLVRTATGAVVSRVYPPKPYVGWDFIAEGASASVFVLAARRSADAGPAAFFKVAVSPAGGTRLSRLPFNGPAARMVDDIALSPDGSELAVAYSPNPPSSRGVPGAPAALLVYPLRGGLEKLWVWHGRQPAAWPPYGAAALSWSGHHTLAFLLSTGSNPAYTSPAVRLLDTTTDTGGTQLNRASHPAPGTGPRTPAINGIRDCPLLTADGTALVGTYETETKGNHGSGVTAEGALTVTKLATGRTQFLDRWQLRDSGPIPTEQVFWTDPAGSKVIASAFWKDTQRLGVFTTAGQFTPLPDPPGVYPLRGDRRVLVNGLSRVVWGG